MLCSMARGEARCIPILNMVSTKARCISGVQDCDASSSSAVAEVVAVVVVATALALAAVAAETGATERSSIVRSLSRFVGLSPSSSFKSFAGRLRSSIHKILRGCGKNVIPGHRLFLPRGLSQYSGQSSRSRSKFCLLLWVCWRGGVLHFNQRVNTTTLIKVLRDKPVTMGGCSPGRASQGEDSFLKSREI